MNAAIDRTTHAEGTRVFVLGAPNSVGGANTELWHTLRLWRRHGLTPQLIPGERMNRSWRTRCEQLGCIIHDHPVPEGLPNIPGLARGIVISFCNRRFIEATAVLRRLECRLIWVNCMTWISPQEHEQYRRHGPFDHYVFQSEFQRDELAPRLQPDGYRPAQGHLIRGAFDIEEFPFRPLAHAADAPFVVGRISRPDPDKFHRNTWSMYAAISPLVRARAMAWDRRIEAKLGPPPPWAECRPAAAESPQEFLGRLHCMIQVNGGARENWPRSGLEAMATGVPIVAQNAWGWREMLIHGKTGFLADEEQEVSDWAARLALDEELRLEVAHAARQALEQELANPLLLWQCWQELFDSCYSN
jgi:hypothetical protein